MNSPIRLAIIGFGNIGQYALEAIQAAPDMECAGIVRRNATTPNHSNVPVVEDIKQLGKVDVALLCVPSRSVQDQAMMYLAQGIHTVDSFDIHGDILAMQQALDLQAKKYKATAILSAGWDPGTDSLFRAIFLAMAPNGITYTNFGPGMSMGHTVAVKAMPGVRDALSMTIPLGTGVHRRMVYVELQPDANFEQVQHNILTDDYFKHDETHVKQVHSIAELKDVGHGVSMVRKGVSGTSHNQILQFDMRINNPALTAQIMVSAARACTRTAAGAYTLIDIPPVHLLPGNREDWVRALV